MHKLLPLGLLIGLVLFTGLPAGAEDTTIGISIAVEPESPFYPSAGYAQIESVELTPATPGVDLVWYHAVEDILLATRYNTHTVINLWPASSTSRYGDDLIIATASFPK